MAKRSRSWNEAIYRRYIREGRGQGCGLDYKPWITVRDFPSFGIVSRVMGRTTGRIYHLMSANETNLFYLLDWSDIVLDIKEQYPLSDLGEVIAIAEKAQIRYPYDNRSGFPYVMTSDFLIETTSGAVALAVKPASELKKPRVREKLEIERRYWLSKDVKWELVTEREINHVKARNIEWLSQAYDLTQFGLCSEIQKVCAEYMISAFAFFENRPVQELFVNVEQYFGFMSGIGLCIYKNLVYQRKLKIDISRPINIASLKCESINLFAVGGGANELKIQAS